VKRALFGVFIKRTRSRSEMPLRLALLKNTTKRPLFVLRSLEGWGCRSRFQYRYLIAITEKDKELMKKYGFRGVKMYFSLNVRPHILYLSEIFLNKIVNYYFSQKYFIAIFVS